MSDPDLFDALDAAPDAPDNAQDATSQKDAADVLFGRLMNLSRRATKGEGDARARLARLRGYLERRGVAPQALRELGNALPDADSLTDLALHNGVAAYDALDRGLDGALLIGTLYALHAAKSDEPWYGGYVKADANFGASCRLASDGSGSMDQRFSALLDARRADLPYRLRQAVALCATKGVGVRYDTLFRNLLAWDDPKRSVQRDWAQAYWAPRTVSSSK